MPKVSYTLGDLHAILAKEKPSSVCLVTSKKVAAASGWALRLIGVPRANVIFVPDGEKAKDWKVLEMLLKDFVRLGLDRSSMILILGGGTVGDLVGFAASLYLRGIRYIQMPTTLVSQVDSAHGGKTGINFAGFKNQIGCLNEPTAIIADSRFIKTLSKAQVIDGLGEIIKCGFIKVKKYYVEHDFRDGGMRNILNFGHTLGHAIELTHKLNHGYSVILGMLHELEFTEKCGISDKTARQSLIRLLGKLGIPVKLHLSPNSEAISHDKKISGKTILMPVVQKIGSSKLVIMKLTDLQGIISRP